MYILIAGGGKVVAVGLDQENVSAALPTKVTLTKREHIGATFDPPAAASPLAGVSPGDVLIRDPRELPLISAGASTLAGGVLGVASAGDGGGSIPDGKRRDGLREAHHRRSSL